MARKSMKDAAAAGTSVFDQIASGNVPDVQDAENVIDVKDVQNVQDAKGGRPLKYDTQLTRLNLKVPADVKEYLTVAAARQSIAERRQISLTEYLIELVRKDAEQHKE